MKALVGVALGAFVMLAVSMLPVPAMGQDSLGFGDRVSVNVTRANQTGTTPDGETTAQPCRTTRS